MNLTKSLLLFLLLATGRLPSIGRRLPAINIFSTGGHTIYHITLFLTLFATVNLNAQKSDISYLIDKKDFNPATLLWYDTPAKVWEEALPVGNGRLGTMVFGKYDEERIQPNVANRFRLTERLASQPELQKCWFNRMKASLTYCPHCPTNGAKAVSTVFVPGVVLSWI